MKDQKNNPDHHEKDITSEKRKWVKPEIHVEDYNNTKADPPILPDAPDQSQS